MNHRLDAEHQLDYASWITNRMQTRVRSVRRPSDDGEVPGPPSYEYTMSMISNLNLNTNEAAQATDRARMTELNSAPILNLIEGSDFDDEILELTGSIKIKWRTLHELMSSRRLLNSDGIGMNDCGLNASRDPTLHNDLIYKTKIIGGHLLIKISRTFPLGLEPDFGFDDKLISCKHLHRSGHHERMALEAIQEFYDEGGDRPFLGIRDGCIRCPFEFGVTIDRTSGPDPQSIMLASIWMDVGSCDARGPARSLEWLSLQEPYTLIAKKYNKQRLGRVNQRFDGVIVPGRA